MAPMSVIYLVVVFQFLVYMQGQCRGQEQRARGIFCVFWEMWSPVTSSACDATCGRGVVTRTRQRRCRFYVGVLTPPPGCGISENWEQKVVCDSGVACTGTLLPWGAWSPTGACSSYCNRGRRTFSRSRTCSDVGLCAGPLEETRRRVCFKRTRQQARTCMAAQVRGIQCNNYITFVYDVVLPVFNLCVHGRYEQVSCPANTGDLRSTCGDRRSPRCVLFSRIESFCIRSSR